MTTPIITVENLSKRYHLGQIGATTLRESAERFMNRLRGRDPVRDMRKIGHGTSAQTTQQHNNTATDPDDLWALKDVSFEVQPGEVLGIIGRNGAGKSTLLKILSRITEPTSGRAIIRGRVASLLEVGTGFHPELTGRENIFLNGVILGMKKVEIARKFNEIVAFSEVERFIDTPVKRYSSGMYVRLAFAVAAHLEPEILIVDEVLAVGDASFQKKCLGKMKDVSREGRTVLFVSHNMTALQALCSNALWLDRGAIAERGSTHGVVAKYLQKASSVVMSREWPNAESAPGCDEVRLRRVAVMPANNDDPLQMSLRTPVLMEFEFWNHSHGAELNLSVVLYNTEGVCIFNTGSGAKRMAKGLVRGRFVVPGNFLNDGSYSVRVLIVKDQSVVLLDLNDMLVFEIRDLDRGGAWFGKWIGAVRPQLEWQYELV